MAFSPQPLRRILDADPTLAGWDARRRREQGLADLVSRHLPRSWADRVRVASAEGPELELAVDAGAIASLLRQRTTNLLGALEREGWAFTGIRVRVRLLATPAPRRKHAVIQPGKESLAGLLGLSRQLPAGPLTAALARLLRRVG